MRGYRTISRISTSSIATQVSKYQILRSISQTSWLQVRIIEVVPALGESITEGSIASWNKNVGDHVTVDEVIVVVETDKVTVDIKSTNAGILVAKLANDTVVVGAPLYELETSSEGTSVVVEVNVPVPLILASVPPTPIHADVKINFRVPLIKFIGKRSLLKHAVLAPLNAAVIPVAPQFTSIQKQPLKVVKEGSGVDFSTLKRGAMFGRPALSQREMDAIESGGATY